MPGLIAVSEFVEETREDYNSPTTSTFVSRMPQCRQTITSLEEVMHLRVSFLNESNNIFSFTALHPCNCKLTEILIGGRARVPMRGRFAIASWVCLTYDIHEHDWCNDFSCNTHRINLLRTSSIVHATFTVLFGLHLCQFPRIDDVNIACGRFPTSNFG